MSIVSTVGILVKRFPRLSETFVLNEILELRRQGIPVRIYAILDPMEKRVQPDAERLRREVRYLGGGEGLVSWLRAAPRILAGVVAFPGGALRGIRFALRDARVETWRHLGRALALAGMARADGVVHLHAHFAHSPAAVAHVTRIITGIPFSFTTHAKDLYTTPPADVIRRARAAEFVLTCTTANREHLGGMVDSVSGVLVRPHGVDLERFRAIARAPMPGRILSIGRLVPKKGFDVLLDALDLLRRRGVAFECRIIGGGPLKNDLQNRVRSLGLSEQVSLLQARAQTDLFKEYAEAEIFALAPRITADGDRDGLPNVIGEAMAAGVPIVSTAISGIPELVESGRSGILVPAGDAGSLADALESLLLDPAARKDLGEAGRERVVAERSLFACVRPLAEMFSTRLGLPGRDAQ